MQNIANDMNASHEQIKKDLDLKREKIGTQISNLQSELETAEQEAAMQITGFKVGDTIEWVHQGKTDRKGTIVNLRCVEKSNDVKFNIQCITKSGETGSVIVLYLSKMNLKAPALA